MKLGNVDVSSVKIGSTDVSKIYIGSTEVWSAFTGLLDTYTGAAAAYSLRQLSSSYSGDAIRVRRASDNAETNIGFVSGELDTSTLQTFCSGTNGFVVTWYDQSGNGNDATQSTSANQPQIVSGGSVITQNGKASLTFDGSNDWLSYSGEILNQSTFVGFCVVKNNRTSGTGRIFDQSITNGGAILTNGVGSNAEVFGVINTGNFILTDTQYYTTQVLQVGQILSGNSKLRINAVDKVTDTTTFTMSGNTGLDFVIGENSPPNGQLLNANLQEIVIYTTDNNSNISGIESNINAQYQIYWDGSQTSLLDTYGGSAAAYSLRALSSSYTGALIKVRRASDNAEQDIYAKYDGTLNTDALESFCSGTNGFVTTWYDQSGNGYDATQTTASNQPQIVSSGSTILENGKPSVQFDGSNDFYSFSINLGTINSFSQFLVNTYISGITFVGINDGNYSSVDRAITRQQSGNFTFAIRNATSGNNANIGSVAINTNQHILTSIYNGSGTSLLSIDSNSETADTSTFGSMTLSDSLDISAINNGGAIQEYGQNKLQELILYPSDQSSNRTNIETNINNFYNIY